MIFTPEKYQTTASDFFFDHDRAFGCIGLGMGKTASSLHALNRLFTDGGSKGALIIAPLRVATLTWPNEIAKWDSFGWMQPESIRGRRPSGKSALYTINYDRLKELKDLDFVDTIVFDEITKAKSHSSARINGLRKLLKPHHRRWGLTGTPRPNSCLELFAQIRLLDDGQRLGRSFSQFQSTYFTSDYMGYNWTPNEGAEEAIYEKIRDLTITMRSSDYLNLPDTIMEDIEVRLPDEAQGIYKQLEKELLVALGPKGEIVAQNAGALAIKLLQIVGGAVYDEERTVIEIHQAKIEALKAVKKRHPKENLLVFTNFIHERERVVAAIPGAVDAAKFKGDIEDYWNSGHCPLLVADPRSLGHGLNMQVGGRIVVWYSPNYSRELYDQANARLARKGQTEQPMIYRLVSPNTIDEAAIETLRTRGDSQAAMLEMLANFKKLALASR